MYCQAQCTVHLQNKSHTCCVCSVQVDAKACTDARQFMPTMCNIERCLQTDTKLALLLIDSALSPTLLAFGIAVDGLTDVTLARTLQHCLPCICCPHALSLLLALRSTAKQQDLSVYDLHSLACICAMRCVACRMLFLTSPQNQGASDGAMRVCAVFSPEAVEVGQDFVRSAAYCSQLICW